MELVLGGFVLRAQQAQEWQLHVHLQADVAQKHPDGWMVDTLQ